MSTHHAIPPFRHSAYTLQWHEQNGNVSAERIFPDGTHDQEQYSVEIPQLDPPINPSLSFRKVIKHLLRQSYIPAVSDKKIVWLSPGSLKVMENLSQRTFSLSSDISSDFSSSQRELLKNPKIEINSKKKFNFESPVHVGNSFNIQAENLEINKLTVHTSSFSPSLTEGIFNLPEPPPHFTGRKEILEELHTLCQTNKKVILSGLGGVGKTATVLQYAEEHKREYSFIHFITGATFDLITEGLLHLANEQKIPAGKPQERLEMLKNHLNRYKKPFLLIFDGVDSPECFEQLAPLLPNQGRSLLVTSRLANQGEEIGFTRLELLPFTEEEAVVYLLKATGDPDKTQAALLAKGLGYLPLALKHAAAYIKKNRQTCEGYLLLFKKHGVQLHDTKYLRLTAQEKTILTTWQISFTAIAQECELSIKLAHFLSCLAHAPIPKVILETWFTAFLDSSDLEFARALGYLEDYSFLDQTAKGEVCNIHILVQKVICFGLSQEEHRRYVEEALQSLVPHSKLDAQVPEKRTFLALFIPHFEKIFHYLKQEALPHNRKENLLQLAESIWSFDYYGGKYLEAMEISKAHLEIASAAEHEKQSASVTRSYHALGLSFDALGKHKKAMKYHKKALEISHMLLGPKHLDLTTSLNNIGETYIALGEYEEALKYHKKALEMMRKLLGPKHSDLAASLNNVGETHVALGKYEEALQYHKEALEMMRELLGPKHPRLATILSNIGAIYGDLGKHQEALKYQREVLEMKQELLGPKHPDLATSLNNVGATYRALGKYEEALKYQREALEMIRELLGPKHPHLASSLNNLGATYGALGKHEEALKYQREALEMRKALLGPKHPDIATSLDNVGLTYGKLGQYEQALKYHEEALKMKRELLEPEHPSLATILNNMGLTYGRLGKHKEALKYHEEALGIMQKLFGSKHPDIATSLNNIGVSYEKLGEYKQVLKYKSQALEMRRELLGLKHPDVAESLNSVGIAYGDLGQHEEALKYKSQALEMRQELLGPKHPSIATSLNNVGRTYQDLGQHEKALKYYEEALQINRELLGPKHPDIATSLNNVGGTYGVLGKHEEALRYYEEALQIKRELLGPKHPDIATIWSNIGATYGVLGEYKEALKYHREVLEMRRELLGPKHPSVANSLSNIGFCYRELKRMGLALRFCKEAFTLLKELNISPNHPHVTQMVNTLEVFEGEAQVQAEELISQAEKSRKDGVQSKALPIYEEAMGILLELHNAKLPMLSATFLSLEIVKKLPLFELCGKY